MRRAIPERLLRLSECRWIKPKVAIGIRNDRISDHVGRHKIEISIQKWRIIHGWRKRQAASEVMRPAQSPAAGNRIQDGVVA